MTRDQAARHPPVLSLIIPPRGRLQQLRRCLLSLQEQTYPRSAWEVIVVVDGEDKAVCDELAAWSGRLPLTWYWQSHAGCGEARNAGAAHAKGDFLVFTDDDCLFPPDWLSLYAARFQHEPECIVAGRTLNALPHNPFSQSTQDVMDYLLRRYNENPDNAALAIGNNFGVPTRGFQALGGFSLRYFRAAAEDRDLCARWRADGRRMVYATEIVVHHAHELTFASFFRQHMHYGKGAWLLHSSESVRHSGARGIEGFEFYRSMFRSSAGVRGFALLLVSQLAQTVGYVSAWRRGG